MKARESEVVRVIGTDMMINSQRVLCHYATRDGLPLAPGFYLVLWSRGGAFNAYDRHARYVGPVESEMLAEKLRTSARFLGILADPGPVGTAEANRKERAAAARYAAQAPSPLPHRHSEEPLRAGCLCA